MQPRPEWGVYVNEKGMRCPATQDLDEQIAFDVWNYRDACEHENGDMLHHYLGNIYLIGLFRQLLNVYVNQLPVIVKMIIYSGSHGGDWLSLDEVTLLAAEIEFLAQIHDKDRSKEQFLRDFERQLRELVACSLKVGKPIAF